MNLNLVQVKAFKLPNNLMILAKQMPDDPIILAKWLPDDLMILAKQMPDDPVILAKQKLFHVLQLLNALKLCQAWRLFNALILNEDLNQTQLLVLYTTVLWHSETLIKLSS